MLNNQYMTPMNPKRVIILGASGFLGSKLLGCLEMQHIPYVALSTRDIDLSVPGSVQELAHLLHSEDVVIVLAVQKPNKNMDAMAFSNNINMAKNIGIAIQKKPVAHVVYFSSEAVYNFDSELITEESPAAPTTLYGAMHLSRELLLKHSIGVLPLTIIRATQIVGLSANHNAYGPCKFYRSAINNGLITLFGLGEERRDFILVQDVIQLVFLILKYRSVGLVNCASGESISYAALANMMCVALQVPITIKYEPRMIEISHRTFDIKLIKKTFPEFRPTSILQPEFLKNFDKS